MKVYILPNLFLIFLLPQVVSCFPTHVSDESNHHWGQCVVSGDRKTVDDVYVYPNPIVIGQDMTLTLTLSVEHIILSGTAPLDLWIIHNTTVIGELYDKSYSISKAIPYQLPITPGEHSVD
ncbi:hypothetical protein LOD99_7037 [Oopsacas minuta]|uniref:Uncharacterized protein n=1 Tax=Oopsacas minuta TaxID=111878 RepID=A0AAV7JKD9_9METZ|nr:hypothetical protein LOD99_7037 [Oopsacas minuta]